MKILYTAFFLTIFSWGELFLWKNGLLFPFTAFFLFYVTGALGWKTALGCGLFAGCALDFVSGNELPAALVLMMGSIAFSCFWLYRVRSDSILLHILPGGGIVLFAWIWSLLEYGSGFWKWGAVYPIALLVLDLFLGMIFLPLLILVLDTLNESLGLPLYSNAKLHLRERNG